MIFLALKSYFDPKEFNVLVLQKINFCYVHISFARESMKNKPQVVTLAKFQKFSAAPLQHPCPSKVEIV